MADPSATRRRKLRRDIVGDRRRGAIVDLLTAQPSQVSVGDLADQFGVSLATIRRDLSDLEEQNLITRTYGGAALAPPRTELDMRERELVNAEAKKAIGGWAAQVIEDDEVVILDAGSTTEQIAVYLGNRPVTVVTNGLRVINRLVNHDLVRVLVLGGALRGFNETIHGGEAEAMLRRIYARRAFVGADALDPVRGVASRTYEQSRLKSLMIENAAELYVVADASKLAESSFNYWTPLPRQWTLVTSGDAPIDYLSALQAAGATPVLCR
ncbi:MAG: DeoR/GlpR family DNA-binding transcription regulator [Micropruina sp.]|uniref:DeoR/GlpR family DNA-binding transcription regulator n=1 Tax=Micropruina sp. TaxID=2737536 RepID=UPI0039E2C975